MKHTIFTMAIGVLCYLGLTACADTKPPIEPVTTLPETSASIGLASTSQTEAAQQEQVLAMLQAQRGETGEVVLVKLGSGVPYAATNAITEYAGETYAFYSISLIQTYLSDELNARLDALDRQNFTTRDEYDFGVVEGWLVFPENENVPRWCVDLEQETVFDVLLRPNPEQDRTDFLLLRDKTIASEYHALLEEVQQYLLDYADAQQAKEYWVEGNLLEWDSKTLRLEGTATRNDGEDVITGYILLEYDPEVDGIQPERTGQRIAVCAYRVDRDAIREAPGWSDYTYFESVGTSWEDDYRVFALDRMIGDVEFYLGFWQDAEQTTSLTGSVITPTYVTELGVTMGGYYSLTLPESWAESVEYEVVPGEAYTYDVGFYHKPDRAAGMEGHLFTLSLIPEWEDYSYLPSYERLGHLEVYRITGGDLVAVYPTDVQFDAGTAVDYQARAAEIDEILASLTFSAEATFTE